MSIFHLMLCSVATFFVLYAPQPLLAQFAQQYAITPAKTGLLMTVTMLPLAIAPICYGLLLANHSKLKILKISMLLLAFCSVFISLQQHFELFLLLRFIEGLLLPAALTAMTSYIGQTWQGQCLRKNMTWYVGSTIAGGYFGRILAANFAAWWSWESFYLFNAALLILFTLWIKPKKTPDVHAPPRPLSSPLEYLRPLQHRPLLRLYSAVFCMFFCFSALLNYLPFILSNEYKLTDPKLIGWVYSGYLVGALISMSTPFLHKLHPNNWVVLSAVFCVYSVSLILMQWQSLGILITTFTLFCACMFIIHASAAPLANEISSAHTSITNGAYVSFYYSGGALGSFLPGLIYQAFGLQAFLLSLLLVCVIGGYLTWLNHRVGKSTQCG
ncbi:MFS transporter [Pseudoalteromonas luteoviolacea]|uniref:MFS transporter n=1 Tax=Pseudoalteromonas luteoviolacea TaxID=43657 RepID=A0A1C0TIX6_9GAMM|nr:MFS transporter [Pseudoalteromonas luteoviolacea]OCQ18154.1 MFS transporter [Pseudoalteromonas luteoviolacea]